MDCAGEKRISRGLIYVGRRGQQGRRLARQESTSRTNKNYSEVEQQHHKCRSAVVDDCSTTRVPDEIFDVSFSSDENDYLLKEVLQYVYTTLRGTRVRVSELSTPTGSAPAWTGATPSRPQPPRTSTPPHDVVHPLCLPPVPPAFLKNPLLFLQPSTIKPPPRQHPHM